jgi:hypothetical protein
MTMTKNHAAGDRPGRKVRNHEQWLSGRVGEWVGEGIGSYIFSEIVTVFG